MADPGAQVPEALVPGVLGEVEVGDLGDRADDLQAASFRFGAVMKMKQLAMAQLMEMRPKPPRTNKIPMEVPQAISLDLGRLDSLFTNACLG